MTIFFASFYLFLFEINNQLILIGIKLSPDSNAFLNVEPKKFEFNARRMCAKAKRRRRVLQAAQAR